jgi:serine/threonine protein kinase
MGRICD